MGDYHSLYVINFVIASIAKQSRAACPKAGQLVLDRFVLRPAAMTVVWSYFVACCR
jgi:hypothetical protein